MHSVFKIRIPYGMTEDFVIKYLWSAIGYGLISIPILFPGFKATAGAVRFAPGDTHDQVAHRTESKLASASDRLSAELAGYISNRRLLISLADAGGRLMYSGKDLAELSGYTSRVYSLLASLHALNNGIYQENPRPEKLLPSQVKSSYANKSLMTS